MDAFPLALILAVPGELKRVDPARWSLLRVLKFNKFVPSQADMAEYRRGGPPAPVPGATADGEAPTLTVRLPLSLVRFVATGAPLSAYLAFPLFRFGVKYTTLEGVLRCFVNSSTHRDAGWHSSIAHQAALKAVTDYERTGEADAYSKMRGVSGSALPALSCLKLAEQAAEARLLVPLKLHQLAAVAWALHMEQTAGKFDEVAGMRDEAGRFHSFLGGPDPAVPPPADEEEAAAAVVVDADGEEEEGTAGGRKGDEDPEDEDDQPGCLHQGASGGMLADEMGLGKTVEVLGLLAHDLLGGGGREPAAAAAQPPSKRARTADLDAETAAKARALFRPAPPAVPLQSMLAAADEAAPAAVKVRGPWAVDGFRADGWPVLKLGRPATLVVVPLPILRQWEAELADKLPAARVAVYQGTGRRLPVAALQAGDLDVVLTTYDTVTADVKVAAKLVVAAASVRCPSAPLAFLEVPALERSRVGAGRLLSSFPPGTLVLKEGSRASLSWPTHFVLVEAGLPTAPASKRYYKAYIRPPPYALYHGFAGVVPITRLQRVDVLAAGAGPLYVEVGRPGQCVGASWPTGGGATCVTCGFSRDPGVAAIGMNLPALHRFEWHRLVMDESTKVATAGTVVSRALRALRARHRWALNGDPQATTLHQQFKILGLPCPTTKWPGAFPHFMCRHTKAATPEVVLPPVTWRRVSVPGPDPAAYAALHAQAVEEVRQLVHEGGVGGGVRIRVLLRALQAACGCTPPGVRPTLPPRPGH